MSDDIRERVRTLLAEHEVDSSELGWSCRCGVYGAGESYVGHLVDDVLAPAGLLPIEAEWGVDESSDGAGEPTIVGGDERWARSGELQGGTAYRRYVGEWRKVGA